MAVVAFTANNNNTNIANTHTNFSIGLQLNTRFNNLFTSWHIKPIFKYKLFFVRTERREDHLFDIVSLRLNTNKKPLCIYLYQMKNSQFIHSSYMVSRRRKTNRQLLTGTVSFTVSFDRVEND